MKFKLKQEKLLDLLEKLIVKDIFPSTVISTKEGKLFSIQKEEHGRALRFLRVNKNFFDEIDDSTESIELDLDKTISIVKNILPNTVLTFEVKGNKVSITGKGVNANISYKEPEKVLTELPFELKDGTPHIGEEKVPLDTHFDIKLPDFKDIAGYAGSLGTEFYKFTFDNDKIAVRIGDLHDFSDYVIFNPSGDIKKDGSLEVFFTYGIPQIAGTFKKEVSIKTKTNSPGWFYEITDEYILGVLIPPYVEA